MSESAIDPPGYRSRVVDQQVTRLLNSFGGLLIEGPKWCGKTWTGRHHANSAVYVDDEDMPTVAALAPGEVLAGQRPRLVDEWQDAPVLWDKTRRIIDDTPDKGLFIFTGSAVPPRNATRHSGTGRFARLRMRPMSLYESGDSSGEVSLASLLRGETIKPTRSGMTYKKACWLISRGGWPATLGLPQDQALDLPGQYLGAVAETDLERVDGVARDPRKVQSLLRSLARHSATTTKLNVIHSDTAAQEDQRSTVSLASVKTYLAALERLFVVDDLPAWRYSLRSRTQLVVSAKRHLVDPSLAVAALGADPDSLLYDVKTGGLLFESLCARDLRVYAQAGQGDVFHYRDAKGLEVDAIVTGKGNKWGAVEVKLGSTQVDKAVLSLLRLKGKLAQSAPEPSFLMVLVASGGVAHTRDDGVHVVPIDCLGP